MEESLGGWDWHLQCQGKRKGDGESKNMNRLGEML